MGSFFSALVCVFTLGFVCDSGTPTPSPTCDWYCESISGDISGTPGTPTVMPALTAGSNILTGSVGNNGNLGAVDGANMPIQQDADFFTFTVPVGFVLTALICEFHDGTTAAFIAWGPGTSFPGTTLGDISGFTTFTDQSGNFLVPLTGGDLAAGDYSIWIQEITVEVVNYALNFVLSST